MPQSTLPSFDFEAFLRGQATDPTPLGLHVGPTGLVVRTFLPGANAVTLLEGDRVVAEMTMAHPEGIFEARLPRRRKPFPYRFRVRGWDREVVLEDAYRFGPFLGDMDHHLLGEGTHYRLYEKLGAHPMVREGVAGVAFAVWAPGARRVSVVGSFNGWDGRRHMMRRYAASGVWELFIPGLVRGDVYKFEIQGPDGRLLPVKADPFAFRCEAAPSTSSVVEGLGRHAWQDGEWMARRGRLNRFDAPLNIYEVHLGSWRRRADGGFLSYRELAEQLVAYVADMGYTHVQFLPVNEHPFYASWGYQPLGMYAPTGRYGPPDDFRLLVDACHQAGIGVILDWVPAHFPEDAHGLGSFDGTHLYEHADPRQGRHMDWGTLIYNLGRTEVQNFLIANALFWLDQYHVDGLRVDAVASMLYLDYSRAEGQWIPNAHGGRENLEAVAFLRRFNEVVYAHFPDCFTVAEESTAWPGVSRPTDQGGLGFGFKWNMGWMHDTLDFFGQNMLWRRQHHDEITFSMAYHEAENFVLALSHDEVVHGKRSLLWKMPGTRWEQFANLRLLLAWQAAHGGKKLTFMGGEFGQDHEWDHNKALDWPLLRHAEHAGVQAVARDLNHLVKRLPALHEKDHEPGGFTWIDCHDRRNSVLAILRRGRAEGEVLVAVLNFSAQPRTAYRVGVPLPGAWEEVVNTDSAHYGGQNVGNLGPLEALPGPVHGFAQGLSLTLPPLGALFLRPAPSFPRKG